jgi:hypothetical protein
MRIVIGVSVLALLLVAGPANANFAYTAGDGLNLDYIPADVDLEGAFDDHDDWTDGGSFYALDPGSTLPVGWRFAQQGWNGSNNYLLGPDTANKTEGDASLQVTPGSGGYNDIFIGTMITGLTVGQTYTVSFDLQIDQGYLAQSGPGQGTGDDHVNSVSWNVMNVADSPQGWGATEDYPGHETGSAWVNDAGDWDGGWHTQSADWLATATEMALVIKIRSMDGGLGSMRFDNVEAPEPASLTLLCLGGLALLRRRGR